MAPVVGLAVDLLCLRISLLRGLVFPRPLFIVLAKIRGALLFLRCLLGLSTGPGCLLWSSSRLLLLKGRQSCGKGNNLRIGCRSLPLIGFNERLVLVEGDAHQTLDIKVLLVVVVIVSVS